ncbi:MBL fold metallo-hydrolase [Lentibacillus sediminis]|uniref:MBL fold metallo-hydrolase n=1 Tax=Lentibacillus sediminis TaxID=1940529 RepID=UPI000C1C242A|nr:MBL fold metallo-hydrolase [Lentibacillus sediminis]
MRGKEPIPLDARIHLLDGFDLEMPQRTGSYVIAEEALTIVETGPSPSVKFVKQGLEQLGYTLDQVRYIIVTHVHLDHAGGAGLLAKECPNAQVVVHPRGERHLADPRKLAAGARAIYGESFSDLFDPVLPVPEERLLVKGQGDILEIGPSCSLKFLDTPGHAKHHFSIYDPISNGMFTGDTAGIRYEQLIEEGIDLFLPTTSPNHFDPEAMQASIDRFAAMDLDRIYFGHFGMTVNPADALEKVSIWLKVFVEEGRKAVEEGKRFDELANRLLEHIKEELRENGIPDDHEAYVMLNLDMQVSALGILDYFSRQNK